MKFRPPNHKSYSFVTANTGKRELFWLNALYLYAADDAWLRRRAQDGRERNFSITGTSIFHLSWDHPGLNIALLLFSSVVAFLEKIS